MESPSAMPGNANGQTTTETNNSGGNGSAEIRQGASQDFSDEEIAARAYSIYEREGRMDGRDAEHWYRAQEELRSERQRTNPAPNAPRSERQFQEGRA